MQQDRQGKGARRHEEEDRRRRDRLPAAVYDLGLRLGADTEANGSIAHLEQSGRMMWLPFEAEVAWEIDGRITVYWQGRLKRRES